MGIGGPCNPISQWSEVNVYNDEDIQLLNQASTECSATDPSTDPTDPSTDSTDPSTDSTDPSTDPTDPPTSLIICDAFCGAATVVLYSFTVLLTIALITSFLY